MLLTGFDLPIFANNIGGGDVSDDFRGRQLAGHNDS